MKLRIKVDKNEIIEDVVICADQKQFLLSWQACKNLGIIPEQFPKPVFLIGNKKKENLSDIKD